MKTRTFTRRYRWTVNLLLLAAFLAASIGLCAANEKKGKQADVSRESGQKNLLNRSLRGAALQLVAASLSDGSGTIAQTPRLPQHVVVLPLSIDRSANGKSSSGPPMSEPVLRARFVEFLTNVRRGDAFVMAPLPPRDLARIARMTPAGIVRGATPDVKVREAARKAGADYVLYGTLAPPPPGARDKVWLANWMLVGVGGNKDNAPTVKASIASALDFGESNDRQR